MHVKVWGRLAAGAVLLMVAIGCASDDAPDDVQAPDGAPAPEGAQAPEDQGNEAAEQAGQRFPDVVDAELTPSGEGRYEITVTISSPYDSPDRYANGWRVLDPHGEVLAEHDLAHHHANEQPFTRTRGPFAIPEGVDEVAVEGRDLEHGYGGETVTLDVPR